jgi:hypothetical protein
VDLRVDNRVKSGDNTGEVNQMLKTDTIQITPDLLALLTDDRYEPRFKAAIAYQKEQHKLLAEQAQLIICRRAI